MTTAAFDREMKGNVGNPAFDLTPDEADALFFPKIQDTAHGYSVLTVLRRLDATTWGPAQADTLANIGVDLSVIVMVTSADNYKIMRLTGASHEITFTAHGLGTPTFGEKLYLSHVTPGLLTTTEPPPGRRVEIGYIIDADTLRLGPFAVVEGTSDVLSLVERSDPPNPAANGESLLWLSDGSGSYAAGDVIITSRQAGVTVSARLVDYLTLVGL